MTDQADFQGGRTVRRTDIDVLRIVLCAAVIVSHALLIFADEPRYHLKSATSSPTASLLYEFLRCTMMPLFFVLAGWSAVVSLRRRPPGAFLRERASRLLVPWFAGIVLLGPIIKYIELRGGRNISASGFHLTPALDIGFLAFVPHYLGRLNLLTWSHLWFLAYLSLYVVLLLPVLIVLSRRSPSASVPSGWAVYLPAAMIALLLVVLRGYWPFLPNLLTDRGNFSFFGLCFLIGAGLAAWPGFEQALRTQTTGLALLGLVGFMCVVLCAESVLGRVGVAATAWGVSGAALGLAYRRSPRRSPALRYLAEATMPIYVLHHVPLLLIGLAVLALDLPVAIQIPLIALASTSATFAIYEGLARPFAPTRLLLGMDPPQATSGLRRGSKDERNVLPSEAE